MIFTKTEIPDIIIIKPKIYNDIRGNFKENYNKVFYSKNGIDDTFVQCNHSKSIKNTLRGLHYQKKYPQSKLIQCIYGEIYDVAVDIRDYSPTYGKWVGKILSRDNGLQMYIPKGFAHGFLVLSEIAEVLYFSSDYFYPEYDSGIIWNDKNVNIDWNITNPILSDKDRKLAHFKKE